jgi:FKBP-type peptidyl-prolyl cis-trans isomerase FkpA
MNARIVIIGGGLAGAALLYAASTGATQAQPAAQPGQVVDRGAEQPADELDAADALAYGVGYFLGGEVRTGLSEDGVEADLDRVAQGFVDGLLQHDAAYDPEVLDSILEAVHDEMMARQAKRLMESDPAFRELAERNAERSRAFMEAFAQREGARELFEGVLYETLESGDGASAAEADVVVLDFEIATIDGDIFLAGKSKTVELDEVRENSRRLVRSMRVGDNWSVAVAPEAAFGLVGRPPDVGPNEVVTIRVKLLEVR